MIALLTRFFGPTLELPDRPGYVYLCPDCYDRLVVPHLDEVNKLLRAHMEADDQAGEDQAEEGTEEDLTETDPAEG